MKALTSRRLQVMLPLGLVVLTISVLLNLTSCTPGSGVTVQESDVVATFYDTTFNFGSVRYFLLPDTIVHLTGDPEEPDSDIISRKYDDDIIALIAANFEARGYDRLNEGDQQEPDFWVLVGASAIQNWYAYGGGYPGYCWWGWCGGWYYPPYWGVSYAYSTGTLFTVMVPDTADIVPGELPTAYWNGAINGVLDDTEQSKVQRLSNSINQMFLQSPYLITGQ
ncbi:MAG: DUF4136 domain-containing protein [Candidatus Latescibacterota bacterium]|nr:MAG: DUF4136 domain-containing protein [Candidatus Latescibacterota bacterium]